MKVKLLEIEPTTGEPIWGTIVETVGDVAYVRHAATDPKAREGWGKWTMPVDRKTGLPPKGWAWRVAPEHLPL